MTTTWTTAESYALETLISYRPTIDPTALMTDESTRLASRYGRQVDDTAYALNLHNNPERFVAFREVAWYGEVGR